MYQPTFVVAEDNLTSASRWATDKHCIFRSGSAWFSVPARDVREIAIAPPLAPIPLAHASLAGICHLRGALLAVVSLNALLDLQPAAQSPPHQLLVFGGDAPWAIMITEVVSLGTLDSVIAPEIPISAANQTPVVATATYHDHRIEVLHPERLLGLAQYLIGADWQERRHLHSDSQRTQVSPS